MEGTVTAKTNEIETDEEDFQLHITSQVPLQKPFHYNQINKGKNIVESSKK